MKSVDEATFDWLTERARAGALPKSLTEGLVKGGYNRKVADEAVSRAYSSVMSSLRQNSVPGSTAATPFVHDPCPVPNQRVIHAFDREVLVRFRLERPQIVVFDNVLSGEECDQLIARAQDNLARSKTVDPTTGATFVIEGRTSFGMFIQQRVDPFVERINRRIAALMHTPVENGEHTQILRYQPGQEYVPHLDYEHRPDKQGHDVWEKTGGPRVATLVMFLNNVEAGGETIFPQAGVSISPLRGSAVYFHYTNQHRQVDPLSLHAGAPVIRGEKWVATQWMRAGAFHVLPTPVQALEIAE
jgi:prolyl 4-hydroxylase